jgi:hypothetical protein
MNCGNQPGNGGFTLYPMYLVYAVVAALAIFWTWKVLIAFAILWGAAILLAMFDDRRHQKLANQPSPEPLAPPIPDHQPPSCPLCGSELFVVEPGATTAQEIIAFALQAESWSTNHEALAGWMPPGAYCAKGCYAIHATPPGPGAGAVEPLEEEHGLPRPVSIRWADAMRDGGSYALAYDTERQETVKVLLKVITTDKLVRTGYRKPRLITIDPATYTEKESREIDWEDAARLSDLLLAVLTIAKCPPAMGGAARASEMIRYLSRGGGL